MSNPRHFKLKVSTFDGTLFRLFFNSFVVPNNFKTEEQLEVIEYFAYEQLEKENADLKNNITASDSVIDILKQENAGLKAELAVRNEVVIRQGDEIKRLKYEFEAYVSLAEQKSKDLKIKMSGVCGATVGSIAKDHRKELSEEKAKSQKLAEALEDIKSYSCGNDGFSAPTQESLYKSRRALEALKEYRDEK